MSHLVSAFADLRVGTAKLLPMIGWPDPKDWARDMLSAGIEWMAEQLNQSTEQRMQETIDALRGIEWPSFDEAWFEYLIGNTFGLVYTLLTLTIMMMGLFGMFTRRFIPAAGRAFGITLILFALNQGMYMLVVTLDKLSQSLTSWADKVASGGGDNPNWDRDLSTIELVADLFGAVFSNWAAFLLGWGLKLEAFALKYFPYIGLVVLVIAFVTWAWTRGGRAGKTIRWTVALMTTAILGKPVMMSLLGIGALVIRNMPADPVWVLLFYMVAMAAPFVIFWLANQVYSSVLDGFLKVEVDNTLDIDSMPSPEPELMQQLLDDEHDRSMTLDDTPSPVQTTESGGLASMLGDLVSNDSDLKTDAVATAAKGVAVAQGQAWALPVIDVIAEKRKDDADKRQEEKEE